MGQRPQGRESHDGESEPGHRNQSLGSDDPDSSATYHATVLYLTKPEDLQALVPGEPPFRARQLQEWLYQHPVLTTEQMTNLPAVLRASLAGALWPFEVEAAQSADSGTTRKWLFRTPDGAAIESVLMGYPRRTTLCISSQVGCALGCTFCATGQFGFERHLEAGEIVAQVAYGRAFLAEHGLVGCPDRITNIVFMGMGEPLANYARVRESIRRIIEHIGYFGPIHHCVHSRSCAGYPPVGRRTLACQSGGQPARRRRRAANGPRPAQPALPPPGG